MPKLGIGKIIIFHEEEGNAALSRLFFYIKKTKLYCHLLIENWQS
jgi:hypothetical protein